MIEQIKDIEGRLQSMEEALNNIVRVGTVVNRDPNKHRCRVEFKDNDSVVSFWCQVLVPRAMGDKFYWMPNIGEMVIAVFLPYGQEQGFILGSAYNKKDSKPSIGGEKDLIIEEIDGTIIIKSDKKIRISAPRVEINRCARLCRGRYR